MERNLIKGLITEKEFVEPFRKQIAQALNSAGIEYEVETNFGVKKKHHITIQILKITEYEKLKLRFYSLLAF